MPTTLTPDAHGNNDFILPPDATSCWVEVGDFSIYILRESPKSVCIEVLQKGDECGAALSFARAQLLEDSTDE